MLPERRVEQQRGHHKAAGDRKPPEVLDYFDAVRRIA